MTLFQSCVLAIVEGFTEFLPISSTGHMILVSYFLKVQQNITLETFEVVSQVGAIAAVVVLYSKRLFEVHIIKKLIIAFIPTGIAGLLIFPYIKHFLKSPLLVASTMTLGGVCILLVEKWYAKKIISHEIKKRRRDNI